jgi:hypothetical protein
MHFKHLLVVSVLLSLVVAMPAPLPQLPDIGALPFSGNLGDPFKALTDIETSFVDVILPGEPKAKVG